MFNRTTVNVLPKPQPTFPPRITVQEHRAPTDESVRLLKEFEKAAEDKVVASIPLKDNGLEGVIQVISRPWDMAIGYRVVFTLNGERFTVEGDYNEKPLVKNQFNDFATQVRHAVAEVIAVQVLNSAITPECFRMLDR